MSHNGVRRTPGVDAALKTFRPLLRAAGKVLHTRFDEVTVAKMMPTIEKEFCSLAHDIPDVGGRSNPFSKLLVNAAGILGMYRTLEPHGVSRDDFANLMEDLTIQYMNAYPGWARKVIGRLWMSGFFRRMMHKRALESQQRIYPDDFVFEVVQGNGDFQWGINYLECGIVKYFRKYGEEELAKSACTLDYVMFPALGVKLDRTETIAQGCEKCDFRFS